MGNVGTYLTIGTSKLGINKRYLRVSHSRFKLV